MPTTIELATSRLRRRLRLAALVEAAGPQCTLALCVTATAFLVARHALGWDAWTAACLFAPLAVLPVTIWLRARSRVPSAAAAVALLDARTGGSGRIVAAAELGDEGGARAWRDATDAALAEAGALPRVAVRRHAGPVACALAFAVAAVWIEPREASVGPPTEVAAAAVERLAERLATLEETLELEPEVAEELEQAVDALRDELDRAQPESTFEALDALERRLERLADEALDVAEAARAELAAASSTQDDPEGRGAALAELALDLADAGLLRAEDLRSEALDELLAQGPAGDFEGLGQLDAGELMEISDELRELLASRAGELARLAKDAKPGKGRLTELEVAQHECTEECEKKPGGT